MMLHGDVSYSRLLLIVALVALFTLLLAPQALAASEYTVRSILRHDPNVTGAQIDNYMARVQPLVLRWDGVLIPNPLIGQGAYWVDAGRIYNIDPVFLMNLAILESGWGSSWIAQKKNNLYGWMAYDRDPEGSAKTFGSFQEGTYYVAGQISVMYLSPGGECYTPFYGPTLEGMNIYYATSQTWRFSIANLMNEFASTIPGYRYPLPWGSPKWYTKFSGSSGFGANTDISEEWGYWGDISVVSSFDGLKPDGIHKRDSVAVFRTYSPYPNWAVVFFANIAAYASWGNPNDRPLVGDFDGDGKDDIGIYRYGSYPNWFFKLSTGTGFAAGTFSLSWGNPGGDTPLVGDFNGDGKDDLAIYRYGSYPNWFVRIATGTPGNVSWGSTWALSWGNSAGDIPLVGNFDGISGDDIGIYRPSTISWYGKLSTGSGFGSVWATTFGNPSGDAPLVGDFNGDGRDDLGIFRTTSYPNWFAKFSTASGFGLGTDSAVSWGNLPHELWGYPSRDTPFIGDFNGDGRDDLGIQRYP